MNAERIVRAEDWTPIERAYAEAMHEDCDDPPPGHPVDAHSPWSGGDLDGVEPWNSFVATLARHGLTLFLSPDPAPFVVRQFEDTPWVPLHEAARLHDAVQKSGLTIATLLNDIAILEDRISSGAESRPKSDAAGSSPASGHPCIFPGCTVTSRHYHGGFPGGYNDPDDPEGPPIEYADDEYNGRIPR